MYTQSPQQWPGAVNTAECISIIGYACFSQNIKDEAKTKVATLSQQQPDFSF